MGKKMLLNLAAETLGLSKHYLRTKARAGEIPCLKCGNRYVFDIEQCEEYLRNKAMENVKPAGENIVKYGTLRKIQA